MQQAKLGIALGIAGMVLASILFWIAAEHARAPDIGEYSAPGLNPMTADNASENFYSLLPALLLVVYDAFARTEEAEIYDTLAIAADGEALETLYLERAGAMVGGGLSEQDQSIHEMRLIKVNSRRTADTFRFDAEWQVIGTVGHSEHLHVRGNTYRADLVVAPIDGAWKITDFELTDVDRETAGEWFEAED